ncbi:MAG: threonylcarbamoyl-AMP synthase [Treponema sp.]|nr:threonylcarbamoyl-AMP synthase [Treponema sp.]
MILKKSDPASIEQTVETLRKGGIVIIPTDTVYGFSGIVDLKASDSHNETDAKIRTIKGRAETKPLIQLIAKPEDLRLYTDDIIPDSLLSKWPGALTIIVHIKKDSPLAATAIPETGTIAFRCPGDVWLRKIIEKCGAPIFSTSVNRSGQPVLDTTTDICSEFENEVDLIIDDGDKKGALPSTLVTIENGQVKVLRQGSVKIGE